jgi:hypothetical protein
VQQDAGNKRITVDISATATVPLWFLRFLGSSNSVVASSAQAVRKNVNLVFVIDRSGSIQNASAGPDVKRSSQNFVNHLIENQDMLGIVSFASDVKKEFGLTTTFKTTAASKIGDPNVTSSGLQFQGYTNSAYALAMAWDMLKNLNDPGSVNIIVFFTDGRPTALSASYPKKTQPDQRYGTGSSSNDPVNTLFNYPASACAHDPMRGFLAVDAGWPPDGTGPTYGLFQDANTTSVNAWAPDFDTSCRGRAGVTITKIGCSSGCNVTVSGNNQRSPRADIAYIPNPITYSDLASGISTATSGVYEPGNVIRYPDPLPSGPYAGQIRPDSPAAVRYAQYNATLSVAITARNDALKPVIFAVGLGGTGTAETIDDNLLMRLANDPACSSSNCPTNDLSKPAGMYAKAADSSDLNTAFELIASEVLRLAK